MNKKRLAAVAALTLSSIAMHLPLQAQVVDITGWGTGTVQVRATDPGRPWGWAVADFMEDPQRQLYNTAKAKLLRGEQIFSHVINNLDIERYCTEAPHYDYTWFEMQHSLMTYDEVAAMLAACPNVGATPILRVPEPTEAAVQKAMDMGMLGIIVPTVEDAIMARNSARFTRFPPTARRSTGGGQGPGIWAPAVPEGSTFRNSVNDNMLIIVMIETVEAVNNALEIASVPGVDVVLIGNADLSSFSGHPQSAAEYHDLQIKVRNATYRAGKFFGNAQYTNSEGNPLSPDSRVHMGGPAKDGWDNPNVPGTY